MDGKIYFQDITAHCPWQKFRSFPSFMGIKTLITTVYRTSGVHLATLFILSNLDKYQIWANLFVTTGGSWSNKQNLIRTGPTLSTFGSLSKLLTPKILQHMFSTSCYNTFIVMNPNPISHFKLGSSVYKFSKMFIICFMSGFD